MAQRATRLLLQVSIAAIAILIADRYANSLVLVPRAFVKPAELSETELAQVITVFAVIQLLLLLALSVWRDPFWANPRRFVVELAIVVCATSVAGVTMFVFTLVPFNPNFYFLIYLFVGLQYVAAYAVASLLRRSVLGDAKTDGLGGAIRRCLGLALSPWMWLAFVVAITPGLLAFGYKKNRDLADAINYVRAAFNYQAADEWMLVDLDPDLPASQPMQVVFDPQSPTTLYYLSRPGQVYRADLDGDSEPEMLLDLTDEVKSINAELGAFSLALHPEYGTPDSPNRGFAYVWYSRFHEKRQFNRLARFDLSLTTPADRLASQTLLMDVERKTTGMHNGGTLQFGPEGFLYISVGDANSNKRTQTLGDSLLSGILRIDVDQRGGDISAPIRRQPEGGETSGYYVPKDNPWYGRPETLEEFWAIGFRNPFRMWIDPQTNAAWVGDVGFEAWEEISRVEAGGNAQWDFREGPAETRYPRPEKIIGTETPPFYAYKQTAMDRAALGGFIYRGKAHPQLYGMYLFADNNSGVIRMLDPTMPDAEPTIVARTSQFGQQGPTSMGLTPDGRVLVTVLGSKQRPDGQILVLAPKTPGSPNDPGPASPEVVSIQQKYVTVCARCHGEDGRGMPELGESEILPKRPDFTSAEWQNASDDARIVKVILDGGPSVGLSPHMPPWRGFLTEAEADEMLKLIRDLGPAGAATP